MPYIVYPESRIRKTKNPFMLVSYQKFYKFTANFNQVSIRNFLESYNQIELTFIPFKLYKCEIKFVETDFFYARAKYIKCNKIYNRIKNNFETVTCNVI